MLSKRLLLYFNHTNYLQRLLTTSQNVYFTNCANVSKTEISITENISVSEAVNSYLKEAGLEYFMHSIPKYLLRKSCSPVRKLCLFDHKTAKEISRMISGDLLQNNSFVIECNPGLGLLTQELLKIGVPRIHLYENYEQFVNSESPLGKLIMEHNERLEHRKLNFFHIWLALLHDKYNADNLANVYLAEVPYHSWQNCPFAQIIAYCPSKTVYSLLMHNFFNQTTLFEHGRPTLFLILSFEVWERIVADNTSNKALSRYYNQYNVLLHLFFEYKCLGEVPRQAFGPWPKKSICKKLKIDKINLPMQVIKLEPKSNTFDLITDQDLRSFWFFLKYAMRTKNIKIIQEMEKWVPGCGPRLILLDIDICTKFKELSPVKLLEIFKNFRTWSEYDENFFTPITTTEEIKKEEALKIELEQAESENIIENEIKEEPENIIENEFKGESENTIENEIKESENIIENGIKEYDIRRHTSKV